MLRIIIADDDLLTRELVCRALRDPQVEIHQAASGAELVQLLADEGPFDLVVTDISMPWMNGIQVILAVRAAEIRTPFVVITALGDPALAQQVASLGRTRFLRKPLDITGLRESVRALLASSSQE